MAFPRILGVLAALAGCAAPGAGTPAATNTGSAERNAAVLRVARAMLASGECREAEARIADAPIRLDDPGFPGAVRQLVRVEGCGGRGLLNVMVAPVPGGGERVSPLFPGTTIADPSLQRDGLRQAVAAARAVAPDCDRITVNETRFTGPAGLASRVGRVTQPWTETWVLGACGRLLAVPMEFTPNEGGTAIRIDGRAVRALN
ncbi:MAG: hypothetical protein AVDCRST_MAG08-3032 [uncultured Acetobacteraceae bacterium]|uniref:Lipoprotein n=1 Tax=uncultured Acetobacteraceae bacterium TaxID=169975 RepID=A0A6J4J5V8_9PROT|nr:MAG: hypothetical protein AVDCRST_MAG08-3032 [uncultured Acetobacteraceae bacterium]